MTSQTVYYTQPKFSPHIEVLANPIVGHTQGALQRGFLLWEQAITGYKQRAVVHYLYNPSTVQANYSVGGGSGNNAQLSQLYPVAGQNSNLVVPMTQSANWTIMFDRTFELMGQGNNKGNNINDPKVAGVNVDILSMMQFTGMMTNTGTKTSATDGSNDIWPSVMQMIPSYAYFGGGGNNTTRYYGYINEWDVTITHWTHNMVPMRCVIDISWSMLPKPANSSTKAKFNIKDGGYYVSGQNAFQQGANGHAVGPGGPNGAAATLNASGLAGIGGA